METISSKAELRQWLIDQGMWYDNLESVLPDVKAARRSKWVDCTYEPDWIFDDVYVKTERDFQGSIDGYVQCGLDLVEQHETVRVYFVRTQMGKHYFTRISKFGYVELLKRQVVKCKDMKALCTLIKAYSKLEVFENDMRFK